MTATGAGRSRAARLARAAVATLTWIVIVGCLAAVIVPAFLDRRYYDGPASDHYDGARFRNPGPVDTAGQTPVRGSRAAFLFAQATGRDGRPPWPDRVAVVPARPERRIVGERMVATWVGHATVLVQTQGLNILTDPVWSDRAGPFGFGPARVAAPGIAIDDLPPIDLIVVSHNHYDHMDLATLGRLWRRDRPAIVTALGNDSVIGQAGVPATALDWGQALTLTDAGPVIGNGRPRCAPAARCPGDRATVHVIRNHHWSSRWFADRNRALWSGFVVALPGGNLFVAGDTGLGDARWIDQAAGLGPVRLALVPIGAFRFRPGQMESGSHIGPAQATEMVTRLGATTALPIHWGTFRLSYEGWDTPPKLLRLANRCARVTGFDPVPQGRSVDVPPYRAQARRVVTAAMLAPCMATPAARALR